MQTTALCRYGACHCLTCGRSARHASARLRRRYLAAVAGAGRPSQVPQPPVAGRAALRSAAPAPAAPHPLSSTARACSTRGQPACTALGSCWACRRLTCSTARSTCRRWACRPACSGGGRPCVRRRCASVCARCAGAFGQRSLGSRRRGSAAATSALRRHAVRAGRCPGGSRRLRRSLRPCSGGTTGSTTIPCWTRAARTRCRAGGCRRARVTSSQATLRGWRPQRRCRASPRSRGAPRCPARRSRSARRRRRSPTCRSAGGSRSSSHVPGVVASRGSTSTRHRWAASRGLPSRRCAAWCRWPCWARRTTGTWWSAASRVSCAPGGTSVWRCTRCCSSSAPRTVCGCTACTASGRPSRSSGSARSSHRRSCSGCWTASCSRC